MVELTKQSESRIWGEYLTIKGDDFKQWYDGLSPIEQVVLDNLLGTTK